MYHNLRLWTGHAPWFREGVSPLPLEMTVFRKACKHARDVNQGSYLLYRYWQSYFLNDTVLVSFKTATVGPKVWKVSCCPSRDKAPSPECSFLRLEGPSRTCKAVRAPCPLRPHLGSQAPTHPENTQDQDGSFQSLTLRVTITHVLQLISGSILKRFLDYKSLNVPGSPAVKTHPFNAGGFNPWGTEIPHASQGKKNLNRKKSLSIWTSQLKGFLTGVKTTVNPISLYWAQRFSTNTFQYS